MMLGARLIIARHSPYVHVERFMLEGQVLVAHSLRTRLSHLQNCGSWALIRVCNFVHTIIV